MQDGDCLLAVEQQGAVQAQAGAGEHLICPFPCYRQAIARFETRTCTHGVRRGRRYLFGRRCDRLPCHARSLWGFTGGVVDAVLNLAGWEQPWEEPWQDGQPVDVVDLFAALETSRNGENLVPALLGDEVSGELQQSPNQDSVTVSTTTRATTRDTTRSAKEVDG